MNKHPIESEKRGDILPPLAREDAHLPRVDRSGVERKSDEGLGEELDREEDRKVERAKNDQAKNTRATS